MRRRLNAVSMVIYCRLLAGASQQSDERRREFILNCLLAGATLGGLLAIAGRLLYHDIDPNSYHGNSLLNVFLVMLATFGLWVLSRAGHHTWAAYLFLSGIAGVTLRLAVGWSFELPTVGLLAALLVMLAGVILETWSGLAVSVLVIGCLLALSHAEIHQHIHASTSWLNEPLAMTNSIDYSLILGSIGLVSWLANLEINRSLKSAQTSRAALARERDLLEERVAARTRELEQLQLERTKELQRFAEFGRINAHLVHEVVNPLTAATLSLDQAEAQESSSIRQARQNLVELERYINAARQQLKQNSPAARFRSDQEVKQVLHLLAPLAGRAGVQLIATSLPPVQLFGDPVKFNQVLANLITNAIDAYCDAPAATSPTVMIGAQRSGGHLVITVKDHGKGIAAEALPQLFHPFYTTKAGTGRGLGIGLSLVKQTVETHFGGHVEVCSSKAKGTCFRVSFMLPAARPVAPLPQFGLSQPAIAGPGR